MPLFLLLVWKLIDRFDVLLWDHVALSEGILNILDHLSLDDNLAQGPLDRLAAGLLL